MDKLNLNPAEVAAILTISVQLGAAEISQVKEAIAAYRMDVRISSQGLRKVVAIIQVLAANGKVGADAGNALRDISRSLKKLSGSKGLDRLLLQGGIDADLAMIKDALGDLGEDSDREALMLQIFGEKISPIASILIGNLDKIKEFEESINASLSIPRRNQLSLNTASELAIRNAMREIEKLPAGEKLTEAVVLLDKAMNLVADYFDETLPQGF